MEEIVFDYSKFENFDKSLYLNRKCTLAENAWHIIFTIMSVMSLNNSPWINMSPHSDTLSWFRDD